MNTWQFVVIELTTVLGMAFVYGKLTERVNNHDERIGGTEKDVRRIRDEDLQKMRDEHADMRERIAHIEGKRDLPLWGERK